MDRASRTVSYTHLDVYKRQLQKYDKLLNLDVDYIGGDGQTESNITNRLGNPSQYDALDVYKRQGLERGRREAVLFLLAELPAGCRWSCRRTVPARESAGAGPAV